MFFGLLSGMIFVALFYFVDAVEITAPPTVNVSHRIASLDLSQSDESSALQVSKSSSTQALLEKDLLFTGSSALGTLNPGSYELPFAQHLNAESPQPLQLQREVRQDVSTGLLVLNAPILPPLSVETFPLKANSTAPRLASPPRIKYQLSPALEKRLKDKIPDTLGMELLGSMPYLKFVIGLDSKGVAQVTLPVTSMEMPADPATYQRILRALPFTAEGKSEILVWGHLWISREEGPQS